MASNQLPPIDPRIFGNLQFPYYPPPFQFLPYSANFQAPAVQKQDASTQCDAVALRADLKLNILMDGGEIHQVTVAELVSNYQRKVKLEQQLQRADEKIAEMARRDERKTARIRQQFGIILDMEKRLMENAREKQNQ